MDWRTDYIVCPHVGADALTVYRSNFRACCEECRGRGFLNRPIEELELMTQGNIALGKIKEKIPEHPFSGLTSCHGEHYHSTYPNLFGGESRTIENQHMSDCQLFKMKNNYRESDGRARCGNCVHHFKKQFNEPSYHKCELIGDSNAITTDIRVFHVCDKHLFEEVDK